MALDPISAVSDAAGKLFDLIRVTLPSDEVRLARFKRRSPLAYARIRLRLENKLYKHLKSHYRFIDSNVIGDEIEYLGLDLPYTETQDLICVLESRFNIYR